MSLRTNAKLNSLAAKLISPLQNTNSYTQLSSLLGATPEFTSSLIDASPNYPKILLNAAKNIGTSSKLENSFALPLATKNSMSAILPVLGNQIASHPFATAGLTLGTGANIAGLVDNKYIGGQLAGGGLGALSAYLIPQLLKTTPAAPMAMIASALGGGTLGSLFDKLREQIDSQQNSYTY